MQRASIATLLLISFSIASPQASAQLFQRHGDGKLWKYDGQGQCAENACPGWSNIDKNPATTGFSAGYGGLYQLHSNGEIWRYDDIGQCSATACPGWTLVDKNPRTVAIAGGAGGFYQRQVDGQIWKYDGHGQCTNNLCPGWTLIDKNPRTADIVAARGTVFQRHIDGRIFNYDGLGRCTENACPGWTLIDANQATETVAGGSGGFYQRHGDGQIFKYDGVGQCNLPVACPGWTQVDKNPATQTIAVGGATLYQLHADGKYWKFDGLGQCSENACPGWTNIDKNPATKQISANRAMAFQRHADGKIWKHDGRGVCSENACPGWTNIDKNPATIAILAIDSGPSPVLGDLIPGSPLRAVQLVRDSDGRVVFANGDFLSPRTLCERALRPPGEPTLNDTIAALVKQKLAEEFGQTPFKMRSDTSVTVSENCNARAELVFPNNIRIVAHVLENVLDLFLTTPDIGPIGLPGSADPHGVFKFDLELHVTIVIPPLAGQQLTTTDSGGKSTNAGIVQTNATFKFVDRVAKFFGDDGLVTRLLREQEISRPISESFLRDINSQIDRLPLAIPYVASYERGSGTLSLRTAE